ncbi:hypothetical protein HDV05_001697 [Chytridiales sp. JEL 0842]|nr:hypothetical protein HDV05_001697 [Chytridiales sp. JEL 0842]
MIISSSTIWNLLLWVGLPWLMNYIRARSSKRPTQRRPRTKYDYVTSAFLLLLTFFWIVLASVHKPLNLLTEWKSTPETPTFAIRREFRQWMAEKYGGWSEGLNYQDPNLPFSDPQKRDMETYEKLYESLKSVESRRTYLAVGHKTFTSCTWCRDSSDFAYFSLPSLLLSYVSMAICLGLGTMTHRKSHWRLYGVIALGGGLIVESYFFDQAIRGVTNGAANREDMLVSPNESYWDKVTYYRHVGFAILSFVVWVFDGSDSWTNEERLRGVINGQVNVYGRLQGARLARAAILGDSTLRAKFFEHYKQEQAHLEAMEKDIEFKKLKNTAMRKMNIGQLIHEATTISHNVIEAATREGLIQGVQLPPQEPVVVDDSVLDTKEARKNK